MAMNLNVGDEEEVISSINTTPLVDVMLVLLIIFLITIPIALQTHPVSLPKEVSQPSTNKLSDINISLDASGKAYWNKELIEGREGLLAHLKSISNLTPQPEVHIYGDQGVAYEYMARVLLDCQRAGVSKVNFLTEPPPKG